MTTGLRSISNRLARQLGSFALGAAGNNNFARFAAATFFVPAPAATIGVNFTYTPTTDGDRLVMAFFNATCSAANIAATLSILKNGAPFGTAALITVDSGGSANHSVQGSWVTLDNSAVPPFTAITYRVQGAVTAQTLAATAGTGGITLVVIPISPTAPTLFA